MTSQHLASLARIGKLKPEEPDRAQIEGSISLAEQRLSDLDAAGLSSAGRFSAAYAAAHALALAALRWHGYRSESRYLVFQCLQHTLSLNAGRWRVLDRCHQLRNRVEYEGVAEIDGKLLEELIEIARALLPKVLALISSE